MKKTKQKSKHIHIQEIPKKYFPKKTKAKEYAFELIRMMGNLRYTNEKIQYGAQICVFNIKSITHKSGFIPLYSENFRQVAEFVYHYENYCFRAYAFREKLLKFINAIFALNFEERDAKIKFIKTSPIVIEAGLVSLIEKFDKKGLGKIIEDRNSLTHKLYYGKEFDHYLRPKISSEIENSADFKKWCILWKKQIISRSKLTNEFTQAIFDMNHELAKKIIKYKNLKK